MGFLQTDHLIAPKASVLLDPPDAIEGHFQGQKNAVRGEQQQENG